MLQNVATNRWNVPNGETGIIFYVVKCRPQPVLSVNSISICRSRYIDD